MFEKKKNEFAFDRTLQLQPGSARRKYVSSTPSSNNAEYELDLDQCTHVRNLAPQQSFTGYI